jgi:uncharacterized membrane protein
MSEKTIQVFVASFDDEVQANQVLKDFKSMDREGSIDLIDAAVVVHTAEGKVTIEESADPSGKTWAKRGAIAGGLVGLIFPPSIVATAAIGGGAGGIWGKVRDKGFKDEDLRQIGESMDPGTSAIVATAEDHVIERLEQGVAGYQAHRQAHGQRGGRDGDHGGGRGRRLGRRAARRAEGRGREARVLTGSASPETLLGHRGRRSAVGRPGPASS